MSNHNTRRYGYQMPNITTLEELSNKTAIATILNYMDLDNILSNNDLIDKFVTILNSSDVNDLLNGGALPDLLHYDISNYSFRI